MLAPIRVKASRPAYLVHSIARMTYDEEYLLVGSLVAVKVLDPDV